MDSLYIHGTLVLGYPQININSRIEYYDFIRINGEKTKYIVTNYGSVYSLKSYKKLKDRLDTNGYVQMHLRHKGRDYYLLAHRLVAQAFIPNPENKPQVNHLDGDIVNNNVNNLEWATEEENMDHAIRTGLVKYVCGEDQGNNKYKTDSIHEVCKLLEDNKLSRYDISTKTGVSYDTITDILSHKSWKHISNLYNIDNYNINCNDKYSENLKSDIIKLLLLNESPKTICNILDLPYNANIVSLIKRCRKMII